jgi:serine/threonine protein kinase
VPPVGRGQVVNGSGHGKGADYWALGCNLYEMVVGVSPFVGDDVSDTLAIYQRITAGVRAARERERERNRETERLKD